MSRDVITFPRPFPASRAEGAPRISSPSLPTGESRAEEAPRVSSPWLPTGESRPSRISWTGVPRSKVAILGWSLFSIEAMQRFNREFVIVGDPSFEQYARDNRIPFVGWDMSELDRASAEKLADRLRSEGVGVAVPLYERLVEWMGVVNGVLMDEPKLYEWSMLFRNKATMKRRAHLADIPVGVFRDARQRTSVVQFLADVNAALIDVSRPVHVKAFDEAGCKGHFVVREPRDAEALPDEAFPCLVESDLEGTEVACEVFIHDGEIVFMNISEYIHLGHSVMMPPSPDIESWREELREMNQQLVDAFDIRHGFIHPEWFIGSDGSIHFGEVAYRVPGGNAFELIERAYGFSAYQGQVLCMDPRASMEEVQAFFPDEVGDAAGHAACLLAYPRVPVIRGVQVPDELVRDPAFVGHDIVLPAVREVEQREHFVNGTHYGNIYLFHEDPEHIRELCLRYEDFDFYV